MSELWKLMKQYHRLDRSIEHDTQQSEILKKRIEELKRDIKRLKKEIKEHEENADMAYGEFGWGSPEEYGAAMWGQSQQWKAQRKQKKLDKLKKLLEELEPILEKVRKRLKKSKEKRKKLEKWIRNIFKEMMPR